MRFDQAHQLQMLQMRRSVIVMLHMSFCDCDAPDERFWMTKNIHTIPQMEIISVLITRVTCGDQYITRHIATSICSTVVFMFIMCTSFLHERSDLNTQLSHCVSKIFKWTWTEIQMLNWTHNRIVFGNDCFADGSWISVRLTTLAWMCKLLNWVA